MVNGHRNNGFTQLDSMVIFHGYVSLPEGILPEKSEKHMVNWGKVLLVDVFKKNDTLKVAIFSRGT